MFGKNGCMAEDEPKPDVLSSLPRTRPQRRSAKRDAPAPAAKAKAKAAPRKASNGAKAGAPKPRAKTAAAKPRAKVGAAPRTKAAAAPKIPPAGFAAPRDTGDRPVPSGVELVGTAIQAAGELAQIGVAVGRQALAGVLRRGGR